MISKALPFAQSILIVVAKAPAAFLIVIFIIIYIFPPLESCELAEDGTFNFDHELFRFDFQN